MDKTFLYYITLIIITYIILEEIYKLTLLVFKYNNNYDYGNLLNKLCGVNTFEYETGRFQLYNEIENLELDNNLYNKKNYYFLIVLFSTIFSVSIGIIFSNVFFNTFINNVETCIPYTNPKTMIFVRILNCFFPGTNLSNCTLSYLLNIIILFIIPLIICMFYIFNVDISYNNNYLSVIYFSFFAILFIYRLPLPFLESIRKIDNKSSIVIYYLLLILFVFLIFYVLNIYEKYKVIDRDEDKYNKDENNTELDKETKFYNKYSKKIFENESNEADQFVIFKNIFGLNIFNKDLTQMFNKTYNTEQYLSSILFYILVIYIFLYILYLAFYKSNILGLTQKELFDESFDYYNIIIISVYCIFTVYLLINAFMIYNTFINKYILYEGQSKYKNDAMFLNKSFDLILENNIVSNQRTTTCIANSNNLKIIKIIHAELLGSLLRYNVMKKNYNLRLNKIQKVVYSEIAPSAASLYRYINNKYYLIFENTSKLNDSKKIFVKIILYTVNFVTVPSDSTKFQTGIISDETDVSASYGNPYFVIDVIEEIKQQQSSVYSYYFENKNITLFNNGFNIRKNLAYTFKYYNTIDDLKAKTNELTVGTFITPLKDIYVKLFLDNYDYSDTQLHTSLFGRYKDFNIPGQAPAKGLFYPSQGNANNFNIFGLGSIGIPSKIKSLVKSVNFTDNVNETDNNLNVKYWLYKYLEADPPGRNTNEYIFEESSLNYFDNSDTTANAPKFNEFILESTNEIIYLDAADSVIRAIMLNLSPNTSTYSISSYDYSLYKKELFANISASIFNNIKLTTKNIGFYSDNLLSIVETTDSNNIFAPAISTYIGVKKDGAASHTIITSVNDLSFISRENDKMIYNLYNSDYKTLISDNEEIINSVIDEYINGAKEIFNIFEKLVDELVECSICQANLMTYYNSLSLNDRICVILKNTRNNKSRIIKKKYFKNIYDKLDETFITIRAILNSRICFKTDYENNKYSTIKSEIIENYNNININNKYLSDDFKKIYSLTNGGTPTNINDFLTIQINNNKQLENIAKDANIISYSIYIIILIIATSYVDPPLII